MIDQAAALRDLVSHAAEQDAPPDGPTPRLLALSGGKGGVGATTLAVNLAVSLAEQGARVVLVDAGLYRADIATLCGIQERGNVADVLSARRGVLETLHRGPSGVHVLPGLWAPGHPADYSQMAQQRLVRQLRGLGTHADWVLLDVGNGGNEVVRRYWHAADEVLLVATPDSLSVMDTYATIKRLTAAGGHPAIRLIVNKAADPSVAEAVHRRIDLSCQRFLGMRIGYLGTAPADDAVERAAAAATPLRIEAPDSAAARAMDRMARKLLAETRPPDPKAPASEGDAPEALNFQFSLNPS